MQTFPSKNIFYVITLLTLAVALTHCGKTSEPASGTFTNVYTKTLKTACIQCHVPASAGGNASAGSLDFTSQTTAYQTLTTSKVTGSSSEGTCGTASIVVASNATNSYLLGVLIQSYHVDNFANISGCTPYATHLSDQNLSTDEQTSIVNWIKNGAAND